MRSLHEKLTCDECGATAEWMYDPPTDKTPLKGWITGTNGYLDFCSAKCAEKHFALWDKENGDSRGGE